MAQDHRCNRDCPQRGALVKVAFNSEPIAGLMHEKTISLTRICARSNTVDGLHHLAERQENLIFLVIEGAKAFHVDVNAPPLLCHVVLSSQLSPELLTPLMKV